MTLWQSARAIFSASTSWLRNMTSRWWGSNKNGYKTGFPVSGGTLPTCSVAPVISPAGPVDAGTLLTVSNGTWANASSFSYQWTENGLPVGSNVNSYTSSTAGAVIGCTVIANGTVSQGASNTVQVKPSLKALAVTGTVNENAANGTVIGQILNTTAGSTITMHAGSDARLAVSGPDGSGNWFLVTTGAAIDYDAGTTSLSFGLDEALATATNTPRQTLGLSVAVINQNDTSPSAFTFTDITNAALSTVETSNPITIAGLGASDTASASVSGAASSQLRKNGGAWTSGSVSVVNGDVIEVRHTSANSGGTATNTTLTVGSTTDTFTSTTISGSVGAFTIAQASGYVAGSQILSLAFSALDLSTIQAGGQFIIEYANTLTPTLNGDNTYAVGGGQTVFSISHLFTESEQATVEDGAGNMQLDLTGDHWTSPFGPYALHAYYLRGDGVKSPMSNQLTGTISASVTQWTSTNGVFKSAPVIVTNSGKTIQGQTGIGAWYGIAADHAANGTKPLWEFTFDVAATDSDNRFGLGFCNASANLGTAPRPGVDDSNGIWLGANIGATNVDWFMTTLSVSGTLTGPNAIAVGDTMALGLDVSGAGGTHSLKLYRVRGGTTILIGTISGRTFTGFTRALATMVSNTKGTANWGGTAYLSISVATGFDTIYA
jgi:hypothetical protein